MKKYKNLIFDVGEVLFSYQWVRALEIAGASHEDAIELGPQLFNDSLWKELDLGIRPYFDVVEDMANKYEGYYSIIKNFLTDAENMPLDRPQVWEEVHRLKDKGYHIFVLSNYAEYLFSKHTEGKPFLKELDGKMVSYMVHINKPDYGIYEALIKKYDLNRKECLFFDDKEENVIAAKECGIDAVQVINESFLLEKLSEL